MHVHFVGSLTPSHHKDLLEIPKSEYTEVNPQISPELSAYRTTKKVFDQKSAVVITHNPKLLQGQMQEIMQQIEKCVHKLSKLQNRLQERKTKPCKGRPITRTSLEKRIKKIISTQYVSEVFDIEITESRDNQPALYFKVNPDKLEQIQEKIPG